MVWPQTTSLLLLPLSLTSGSDFRVWLPALPSQQPCCSSNGATHFGFKAFHCSAHCVVCFPQFHLICSFVLFSALVKHYHLESPASVWLNFSVSSSQTLSISEIVLFIDMFICFYVLHSHLFSAISVIKGRTFIFIFTFRHGIKLSKILLEEMN